MSIKGSLRKITELGISIAAVATLTLAGCGGGGSSNTSACTATGSVSGAAAVDCFFAETAHANWQADLAGMSNAANTSRVVATGGTSSLVAIGANSYTLNFTYMELPTIASAWAITTPSTSAWYYLSAAGWQSYDSITYTYTNNGDGTIGARFGEWLQGNMSAITRTDLTGQPVACTNPMGSDFVGENIGSASNPIIVAAATCTVAVTYPAGSASYTTTSSYTMSDSYMLWDQPSPPC